MAYNPRRHSGRKRDRMRKYFAAQGAPCALCGKPIDYSLPHTVIIRGRRVCNDAAFELDEICPVSRWREGGYASPEACVDDVNNLQPAHRLCNRIKSNMRQGKTTRPTRTDTGHGGDTGFVADEFADIKG